MMEQTIFQASLLLTYFGYFAMLVTYVISVFLTPIATMMFIALTIYISTKAIFSVVKCSIFLLTKSSYKNLKSSFYAKTHTKEELSLLSKEYLDRISDKKNKDNQSNLKTVKRLIKGRIKHYSRYNFYACIKGKHKEQATINRLISQSGARFEQEMKYLFDLIKQDNKAIIAHSGKQKFLLVMSKNNSLLGTLKAS